MFCLIRRNFLTENLSEDVGFDPCPFRDIRPQRRIDLRMTDHAPSTDRRFMRPLRVSANSKSRHISDLSDWVMIDGNPTPSTHFVRLEGRACFGVLLVITRRINFVKPLQRQCLLVCQ